MRNLILAAMFLLCQASVATIAQFSASATLPGTFTVDNARSELATCGAGPYAFAYNGTSSIAAWGLGNGVDTVPTVDGGQIPPYTGVDLQGYLYNNGSDAFFIRNYSGTAGTDGYFILQCAGVN